MFLDGALPSLIHLSFSLQRDDSLIQVLFMICWDTGAHLLSYSVVPNIVKQFRNDELSKDKLLQVGEIGTIVFIGFLARSKVEKRFLPNTQKQMFNRLIRTVFVSAVKSLHYLIHC